MDVFNPPQFILVIFTLASIAFLGYWLLKMFQYPIYLEWTSDRILGRAILAADIKSLIQASHVRAERHEWFSQMPSVQLKPGEAFIVEPTFCALTEKQIGIGTSRAGKFQPPAFALTNQRLITFGSRDRSIWKGNRPSIFNEGGMLNLIGGQATFSERLPNGEAYPNTSIEIKSWGTQTIYHPQAEKIAKFFNES